MIKFLKQSIAVFLSCSMLFCSVFTCRGIDSTEMARIIKEETAKNRAVIGSSCGKDIVSFVGNTGAGKSTVVNLLAGRGYEIDVNRDGDIISVGPKAFKIGITADIGTIYPECAVVGSRVFYDFPGFSDVRGGEANIVNAALIHNVFSQARSNLMVFVIGMDEVVAGHGIALKDVLELAKQWVPSSSPSSVDGKCFVFTKSDKASVTDLKEFFKRKISPQYMTMLSAFFDAGRVFQMHKPVGGRIVAEDRRVILDGIQRISGIASRKCNVSLSLPVSDSSVLQQMFESEMSSALEADLKEVRGIECDGPLNKKAKTLALVKAKNAEFCRESFLSEICTSLSKRTEMALLIPVCSVQWNEAQSSFITSKQGYLQKWKEDLRAKESILVQGIKNVWTSEISNTADEFIRDQYRRIGMNAGCSSFSSLATAEGVQKRLCEYLSCFHEVNRELSELVKAEASEFHRKSGVSVFSDSPLPAFLNDKLEKLRSSVEKEKRRVDSYIAEENARIQAEEAERKIQEEAIRVEEERTERLRRQEELKREEQSIDLDQYLPDPYEIEDKKWNKNI